MSESPRHRLNWTYEKRAWDKLLRLAPWADLLFIREEFTKQTLEFLKDGNWVDWMIQADRAYVLDEIELYMSGERPNLTTVTYPHLDRYNNFLHTHYEEDYRGDPQASPAFQALKNYMFHRNSWLPISPF